MKNKSVNGLEIESVLPDSIAEEFELSSGDRLLAVNGIKLRDVVDYSYFTAAEEELILEIKKPDGEIWELEVERDAGEPLGLVFTSPPPAKCRNNCLFCFVHQLPKGLRKPLYVKDEDYRLSFLNGNYVTLANISNSELARIVEQRLSPLYISVHATNPELREKLLGVSGIPLIMEQLQFLAAARIQMHAQIVLCPRINDGKELERTVDDLVSLYPAIASLAIVPLGLTSHRTHLPLLQPVDSSYAASFVKIWQNKAKNLKKSIGEPFLFLADEWYLKGSVPFPPISFYGDFPQIENGVGMVSLFLRDVKKTLRTARKLGIFKLTVVTGCSVYPIVKNFVDELAKITKLDILLIPVENKLFGPSVTVTGLLSGNDIVNALSSQNLGSALLIPDVMIKEGESIFLDDISIDVLSKQLHITVLPFESTPQGFYTALKQLV